VVRDKQWQRASVLLEAGTMSVEHARRYVVRWIATGRAVEWRWYGGNWSIFGGQIILPMLPTLDMRPWAIRSVVDGRWRCRDACSATWASGRW
ncbi:MAG: hypothetical protein KDA38_17310, partial [Planctomycetales bacterium]|nr:hypothetical protein [Planctomycetales bacterium]